MSIDTKFILFCSLVFSCAGRPEGDTKSPVDTFRDASVEDPDTSVRDPADAAVVSACKAACEGVRSKCTEDISTNDQNDCKAWCERATESDINDFNDCWVEIEPQFGAHDCERAEECMDLVGTAVVTPDDDPSGGRCAAAATRAVGCEAIHPSEVAAAATDCELTWPAAEAMVSCVERAVSCSAVIGCFGPIDRPAATCEDSCRELGSVCSEGGASFGFGAGEVADCVEACAGPTGSRVQTCIEAAIGMAYDNPGMACFEASLDCF